MGWIQFTKMKAEKRSQHTAQSHISDSTFELLLDKLSNLNVQAKWLCIQDSKISKAERKVLQMNSESSGIRFFI